MEAHTDSESETGDADDGSIAQDATDAALLTEYRSAQMEFLLYGVFPVMEGAILSAGTIAFWGFLLNANATLSLHLWSSLAVTALMSIWALHNHQSRQIYMYKLHRIHEIEAIQYLRLHTRFVPSKSHQAPYHIFGPSGHRLLLALYAIASLAAPTIALVKTESILPLICSTVLVSIVIFWISRNERALKRQLAQLRSDQNFD